MSTETGYFLENAFHFTRLLRRAGIPVSPEQSRDFTLALTLIDIGDRDQFYHAARSQLVTHQNHLRLFEVIFNRFWRVHSDSISGYGQKAPIAPRHKTHTRRLDIFAFMAQKAQESDQEIEVADRSGSFSRSELLQQKDFSQMTPEELETIKQLMMEMSWRVSLRQTRRWVPDSSGSMMHLRRAMRSTAKYGGVPLDLFWQRRKSKQRPFVLLADISGSMEKYSRLILQFFYSISHSFREVECFVFGTRLTRITSQLRLKNIDRAIDEAALEIIDWSGGTRIGESLGVFNKHWSRRVLRRGAIVLIVSDGWERGDVSMLEREMFYLQHRCSRLIWLNPLSGTATYQPLVEGMAAALPFVDDFLPIHNLQSLASLSRHLAELGQIRSARGKSLQRPTRAVLPEFYNQ